MDNAELCKHLIQEIQVKENLLERIEHERSKVKKEIKDLNKQWKECMENNQLDMFGDDCG